MTYPVLSYANTSYAQTPPGTQRVSLRLSAPYPVQANAGVGAFRKPPGGAAWTTLPSGVIDNSSNTATPDVFDLKVDPGFEYAFSFKGAAMAVAPGATSVNVGFGLFANDVQLLTDFGGPKSAQGPAAGLVGAAYFRT